MITIGSSSSRPDESGDQDVSEAAEKPPKHIPLAAIPVILAVGLVVAAGYVGTRIWAARPHTTAVAGATVASPQKVPGPATRTPAVSSRPVSTSTVVTTPAATTPATVNKQPAREAEVLTPLPTPIEMLGAEQATRDDNLDLIAPQHGERYLQIAAINARYTQKFLAEASRYNVQASVAPGPNENLVRVVIGPFSDREALATAKAQIQLQFPDCFVRVY